MANVAHSTLTGSNLHEAKGVASATAGQVSTADGAGATVYTKLTAANLQTTGNPFGAQLLHLRYSVPNGTVGGTPVNLTWTKYPVNTAVTNEIASATLTTSVISLPSGTYHLTGSANFRVNTGSSKLRLRNTTAGSTLIVGRSIASDFETDVPIAGRFVLSGTSNLELQYFYSSTGSNASTYLGTPANPGSAEVDVYSDFMIWKIA